MCDNKSAIATDGVIVTETLYTFLNKTYPEFLDVVPCHWLEQHGPTANVELFISIAFLIICVPGNVSQLLVLGAYAR